MKKIIFTFGRYNPPTTGHAELITYTVKLAQVKGADHRIYTSQSHDSAKNPLTPRQKMMFLRQIFPGVNFVDDPSMKTAFIICKKLVEEGYEDVTFVVGDDRVQEFTNQLGKYVKPRTAKDFDPKKHYPFKKFQVVSSGARRPGISGTDLRNAIRKNDFPTFVKASAARDKTLARKIFDATRSQLKEDVLVEEMTRKEFDGHLKGFIDFTCDKLGIKETPKLRYKTPEDQGEQPSFAAYSPSEKVVHVMTKNRHPMDVFRSVAHELVHHKQNEEGLLGRDIAREGSTGSDIENDANSRAGQLMRWYGKANPQCFSMSYVTENKAIILTGTPGSGKDKILKRAILPQGFNEVSCDGLVYEELEGNIVINGAAGFEKIRNIKENLESVGFETMMVFVNTSNEVSRQRNEDRRLVGGRVINEAVRYTKWSNSQKNLNQYDRLFEKVIEIKNDLDVKQDNTIVRETYDKMMVSVGKEIRDFTLSQIDRKFEYMISEEGGAGNEGTKQLVDRYKKDTPGQTKNDIKIFSRLPAFTTDRLGQTYTSPKNPTMNGDTSSDDNPVLPNEPAPTWSPIDRWMIKEETRKMFKEKYGRLAEKKLQETVNRLKKESLTDPYDSSMGATPNSLNRDEVVPPLTGNNVELRQVVYGKIGNRNKLNRKK